MLSKPYRLKKDFEIQSAFRTKFQSKSQYGKVFLAPTSSDKFQLLVVISKKVFKKANKRNRLRRKIQAIFETLHKTGRLPPSTSCLIQVTNPNLLYLKHQQLKEEILPEVSKLFQKRINKPQARHKFSKNN